MISVLIFIIGFILGAIISARLFIEEIKCLKKNKNELSAKYYQELDTLTTNNAKLEQELRELRIKIAYKPSQ